MEDEFKNIDLYHILKAKHKDFHLEAGKIVERIHSQDKTVHEELEINSGSLYDNVSKEVVSSLEQMRIDTKIISKKNN